MQQDRFYNQLGAGLRSPIGEREKQYYGIRLADSPANMDHVIHDHVTPTNTHSPFLNSSSSFSYRADRR
ncbi:hypothetical protein ACN38_g11799 [Penicillium nordicum]|uniref:Uncharacterized protein n=1 Tax=Penicillium nordicum TaxID=229535 RepID=A0A0M8NRT3_9EURO|nr:hypothetical protein ACN38_g11799 [Penicillium nordicum]